MNRSVIPSVSRHIFAGTVLLIGSVVLTAVTYGGLLAWAIIFDGGLGGPLALPGMVLMAIAFTGLSVLFLLLPATVGAERLSPSHSVQSRIWQIPLSSILLIVLLAVGLAVAATTRGWSTTGTLRGGLVLGAIELLLLGGYWWSLQLADVGVAMVLAAWRRVLRPLVAGRTVG